MLYKLEVYNISTIHKIKEKWIKGNDNKKKRKTEMKGTRRCSIIFLLHSPSIELSFEDFQEKYPVS